MQAPSDKRRPSFALSTPILSVLLVLSCGVTAYLYFSTRSDSQPIQHPAAGGLKVVQEALDEFGLPESNALWREANYWHEANRVATILKKYGGIVDPNNPGLGHTWQHQFVGAQPAQQSYWNFFAPLYSCPAVQHIGNLGDGGKFLCAPTTLLTAPTCVIYSFGSNGVVMFEQEALETFPCDIHVFDPTVSPQLLAQMEAGMNENRPRQRIWFHSYGLSPRSFGEPVPGLGCHPEPYSKLLKPLAPKRAEGQEFGGECEMKTLEDFMKGLGHKWVDVLKIDIEGGEFTTFYEMFDRKPPAKLPFTQLAMEVHFGMIGLSGEPAKDMMKLLQGLQDRNMHAFHLEVNSWNAPATCVELSWIKIDPVTGRVINTPAKNAVMNTVRPVRGW